MLKCLRKILRFQYSLTKPHKIFGLGRRSKGNKNDKTPVKGSKDYGGSSTLVRPESSRSSHDNNNNNSTTNNKNNKNIKKEEGADTLLSDFCSIVENAHKLKEDDHHDAKTERPLRQRRAGKRKISHSEGGSTKSPKSPKKEKRASPPLEYNVDFMSDLPAALADKDAVERIVEMQSRMNAMRKLYCKLRSEVASIDRKKRRKLRKQLESAKQKACGV